MRKNIEPLSWQANLLDFGKRNKMRPTRLGVLGPAREAESDFWLEDGLLFAGIALEMDGDRGPSIEVMLQASAAASFARSAPESVAPSYLSNASVMPNKSLTTNPSNIQRTSHATPTTIHPVR